MDENPLIRSLKELCAFLEGEGIDYMLVGGLAVGLWGPPRATVDVDFPVSFSTDNFASLSRKLRESDRFIFVHDRPMAFEKITLLRAILKSNTSISVDFLFADDEFKREALRRKDAIQLSGFSLKIPTPEDLILLNVLSNRPQDLLDAEMVYKAQKKNLDTGYLQRWAERLNIVMPFT